MLSSYLTVTVISEWVAFLVSLLLLDRKTTYWRLFIPLLFVALCVETIGWYLYNKCGISNNALPFNILLLLSNLYFIWFLSKANIISSAKSKFQIWGGFYLLFALVNLFFFQGVWIYNSYSESLGDIIVSIMCFYLVFSLLKSTEHIDLLKFDYFWLASGLLFYCLGSALLYQFSTIFKAFADLTHFNIGEYINYALNIFLNSCLVIAFICRRKATR